MKPYEMNHSDHKGPYWLAFFGLLGVGGIATWIGLSYGLYGFWCGLYYVLTH